MSCKIRSHRLKRNDANNSINGLLLEKQTDKETTLFRVGLVYLRFEKIVTFERFSKRLGSKP